MGDNLEPVRGLIDLNVDHAVEVLWRLYKRMTFWGLMLALLMGVAYVLYRLRSIIISVVAAVVLTYVLLPGVEWMCRRRMGAMKPKTQRLIATALVMIIFLGLVAAMVSVMVNPFKHELADFQKNLGAYTKKAGELLDTVSAWYAEAVPNSVKQLLGKMNYSTIQNSVTKWMGDTLGVITSSVGFFLELALIPVLAFYFVLDYKSLKHEVYGLLPVKWRRSTARIGRGVGEILQSYIFGQIILCVIAGAITAGFLGALDMPYIVVLALFAAITRAIPVIGPVLSGIPIVLVGLLRSQGLGEPVLLLGFVVVMHFGESKFLMPHLIGERLHLHPAVIIIALLIGAEFFGLVGMFLAAPVAAITRELVRLYYVKPRESRERKAESRESDPARSATEYSRGRP